jgi:hypothetical protein
MLRIRLYRPLSAFKLFRIISTKISILISCIVQIQLQTLSHLKV